MCGKCAQDHRIVHQRKQKQRRNWRWLMFKNKWDFFSKADFITIFFFNVWEVCPRSSHRPLKKNKNKEEIGDDSCFKTNGIFQEHTHIKTPWEHWHLDKTEGREEGVKTLSSTGFLDNASLFAKVCLSKSAKLCLERVVELLVSVIRPP